MIKVYFILCFFFVETKIKLDLSQILNLFLERKINGKTVKKTVGTFFPVHILPRLEMEFNFLFTQRLSKHIIF